MLRNLNLISLALTIGLTCYTFYTLTTDAAPDSACAGTSVKWFLYLVFAMHLTNILQAVCEITGLKHCFCDHSKNFWLDLYEVFTVLLMTYVMSGATPCDGTI